MPYFKNERRESPEIGELRDLLSRISYKGRYEDAEIFLYIEKVTGIAQEVVKNWLNNFTIPSSSIRNQILACLRNYREGDFQLYGIKTKFGTAYGQLSQKAEVKPDKKPLTLPAKAEAPPLSANIEKIYLGLDQQETEAYLDLKKRFPGTWFSFGQAGYKRPIITRLLHAKYLISRISRKARREYQVKEY